MGTALRMQAQLAPQMPAESHLAAWGEQHREYRVELQERLVSMTGSSPNIPAWIREFAYPGYVNVYSLKGLEHERKLFCTETLFGDWNAPTLFLAKDAAPAHVIRDRIQKCDPDPWRHGHSGDPMGHQTNKRVAELAAYFNGSKLYGSALAHLLKEDDKTSGALADITSGRLHDHLKRVLEFVVQNMPNLQAIVCLGNDAHGLVSSCTDNDDAVSLQVGECVDIDLFKRRVLIGRLYHPSRAFKGGFDNRRIEWRAIADLINKRIVGAGQLEAGIFEG